MPGAAWDVKTDDEFVRSILSDDHREVVLVEVERPARVEPTVDLASAGIPAAVAEALRRSGIARLYDFQAGAIRSIRDGRHTVIVAGTGFGKTEAFAVPVLEEALGSLGEGPLALVIYPTKALARDQVERLRRLADPLGVRVMVYDGDTPPHERKLLYQHPPHVLVSNPDMVNQSLIHVYRFRRLLRNVRYVVLDDFHHYGGVLGSHMYMLLRRLRRFVRRPTFVGTSATIGNPEEFGRAIFGVDDVEVVEGPRGRRGPTYHILVRPLYRSKFVEAANIAKTCIEMGKKCIVFTDSHRLSELVFRVLRMGGYDRHAAIHRAGLDVDDRVRVERMFRRGEIDVVIATPTLELGIDVGDADVVVNASIPPSFSRYLQRIGRIGRRGQTAYAVQILGNDPMGTYYRNFPREFLERRPEPVGLERENEDVARAHLLAMAADMPIRPDELSPFELRMAEELLAGGLLEYRGAYLGITRRGREELRWMNLRGVGHVVKIRDLDGDIVGHRELPLALFELHPNAIYLHGGRTYVAVSLDLERMEALVRRADVGDLYTQALEDMEPHVEDVLEEGAVMGVPYIYGKLRIRRTVYGYALKRMFTEETVGEYTLDEPLSYEFRTKGIVLRMPIYRFSSRDEVDFWERAKAYHAAEHVLITAAEIVVGASKTDLGGVSFPSGHVVIYDSHVGGSGTARLVLANFPRVVEVAHNIVSSCDCMDGCPKCVFSVYCGNNNKYLSRRNARAVLGLVLRRSAAPTRVEPVPREGGIV